MVIKLQTFVFIIKIHPNHYNTQPHILCRVVKWVIVVRISNNTDVEMSGDVPHGGKKYKLTSFCDCNVDRSTSGHFGSVSGVNRKCSVHPIVHPAPTNWLRIQIRPTTSLKTVNLALWTNIPVLDYTDRSNKVNVWDDWDTVVPQYSKPATKSIVFKVFYQQLSCTDDTNRWVVLFSGTVAQQLS